MIAFPTGLFNGEERTSASTTPPPSSADALSKKNLDSKNGLALAATVSASGIRTQAEQLSVEQLGLDEPLLLAETFIRVSAELNSRKHTLAHAR